MIDLNAPPNEVRNFVHKRISAGLKGFVTSGFNPVSGVGSFLAPVRKTLPRTQTARPSVFSEQGKNQGRMTKFGAFGNVGTTGTAVALGGIRGRRSLVRGGACPGLTNVQLPDGSCFDPLNVLPGGDPVFSDPFGGGAVGAAVMGRYGAALVPGSRIIDRAVCLRGMVVADDGLCYNKKDVTNKQRMWPRGRRPLLTGGDMRAISIAARAGRRLELTTKRLQKIGLMKKPAKGPSRRQIAAEVRTEMHHSST